ncbi:hypothetical protein [Pseudonocardia lacus]|uniref:hypothetical protein n=1 Tax=Pseudonocardia lacus TaxID=2835865 RepID=UPI001BDBE723|nr:hypothetical protein [Pseudonocardia lacus]
MSSRSPHAQNAGASAPTGHRGPWGWFTHGGWYLVVIVLSIGMLAFVPFVHAAIRTHRALMWLWAVLYSGAVITLFILAGPYRVGGWAIGLVIVASIHSLVLRQQVWKQTAVGLPPPPAVDPAIAAVLAARARREEARRVVERDPAMARELGIGRPDLPRSYDDGGLVDLAAAPAEAIASACDIDLAHATLITEARDNGIHFATVDDVFSVTDIPFPLWERIRDRGVVVTG